MTELPSKVVAEVVTVKFDFTPQIPYGVSIVDVTMEVVVLDGTDASPSDILFGDPVFDTTMVVTQQIYQGTGGVVYGLKCTAETETGRLYVIQHTQAILTNVGDFGPGQPLALEGSVPETACYGEDVYFVYSIIGGYPPYGPVTISAGAMPSGWVINVVGTQVIISNHSEDAFTTYNFTIHLEDFVGNVATADVTVDLIDCSGGLIYVAQAVDVGVGFSVLTPNPLSVDHTIGTNQNYRFPAITPDGSRIFYQKRVGGMYVMDTDTEVSTSWDASVDENTQTIISSDGALMASISFSPARFLLWDLNTNTELIDRSPPSECAAMCFSADNTKIYLAGYTLPGWWVYNIATDTFTRSGGWTHYSQAHGIVYDESTNDILIICFDSILEPQIIRWSTNLALDPGHDNVLDIGNLPDTGSTLLKVNDEFWTGSYESGSDEVYVFDSNLNLTDTIQVGLSPKFITVNAARTRVYVCNTLSSSVTSIDVVNKVVLGTCAVDTFPYGAVIKETA